MKTMKKSGEFYRADLSHAVNTLGAAKRSLERMEGRGGLLLLIRAALKPLEEELEEARKSERQANKS